VNKPKLNDLVEVYYDGGWVPFLVYDSNIDGYDETEISVHGWLFRPEHDGAQWHGSVRSWEGDGISNKDPGDLGELHWRPSATD